MSPAKGRGAGDLPEDEPRWQPLRWPVMRKALAWMAPYRKQYMIGAAVGLTMTLLDMLGPMYIRHLLDDDVPQGRGTRRISRARGRRRRCAGSRRRRRSDGTGR